MDRNCGREVVLPHDPQSLPPQSPVVPESGLGPSIGPRLGAVNCAQEQFRAHTRVQFLANCITPPSPHHVRTLRARYP